MPPGLNPGARLGCYEVKGPLGAGGMGEVFHAHDTRLGREVALKLLPGGFDSDPALLGRLEHEARALASLQHPHVATLYAFEEQEGRHFLVMELVPGETLAERIARGPLPPREALLLFRQIALGLEAAHAKLIVHRDLKPANLRITPDGQAKVLDFGLALADPILKVDPDALTLTSPGSGRLLGTLPYMSPEQARGLEVDRRTDVWAFGASLYEALTGRRAFAGPTGADVLAAVMTREPDWDLLPRDLPSPVVLLLRRCLRKDLPERLHDISDARILITEALETPAAPAGATTRRGTTLPWAVVALAGAALLAAGAILGTRWRAGSPLPVRRFTLDATPDGRVVISPDGRRLAYTLHGRLCVRDLDRLAVRELTEENDVLNPFWSPDSRSLAFAAAGRLEKTAVEGGRVGVVCSLPAGATFLGGAWDRSGRIVAALGPGQGLFSVPADGGELRELLRPDPAKDIFDFHWPAVLPDGRSLLLVVHPQTGARFHLAVLRDGVLHPVLGPSAGVVTSGAFDPGGHVLFQRMGGENALYSVPFSATTLAVGGEPVLVAEGGGAPSVSDDGTLAYVAGRSGLVDLVVVDRSGRVEQVVAERLEHMRFPRVSPDGQRVAVSQVHGGNWDVWAYDLAAGTRARLTTGPEYDTVGSWSARGDRLAITSGLLSDSVLLTLSADGTGHVERTPWHASGMPEGNEVSPEWSPDGRFLIFRSAGDLFAAELGRGESPRPLVRSPFTESEPRLSPDGRFLAYMSNETGRFEVYVRRFPEGEGRWTVSTAGGALPRWSRRGDELFYVEDHALMAVPVATRPAFRAGTPVRLFDAAERGVILWSFNQLNATYDPLPDGRRFVLSRGSAGAGPPSIVIVENWARELGLGR